MHNFHTNPTISQHQIPHNPHISTHQQLVFGDSMFIFYDQTNINTNNKQLEPTSMPNRSKPKINYTIKRAQMMTAKERVKTATSNARANANANAHGNGNGNGNDNGNNKSSRNSKLKKCTNADKTMQQNRTQSIKLVEKENYIEQVLLKRPKTKNKTEIVTISSRFSNTPKLKSIMPFHDQEKILLSKDKNKDSEIVQCSQSIKIEEEAKIECGKVQEQEIQLHNLQINSKLNNLQAQKQVQVEKFPSHEQFKSLFGPYHRLLLCNRDYLSFITNQKDCKTPMKFPYNDSQKKIERQIEQIKSPVITTTFQNKSQLSKFPINSSLLLSKGVVDRAPILPYLKMSQTKKLFTIMIQHQQPLNQNYMDPQFNHQELTKIDGQSIQWIYINPNSTLEMFPPEGQACNSVVVRKQDQVQLQFVSFLKVLFYLEPNLIKRLFEPPINNVYSVWLFVKGCFEPVFIDGYFPLNSKLDHLYGDSGEYLWLPVLVKCICKVYNSFSKQSLSQIDTADIYRMLTGLGAQKLCRKQIESSRQLTRTLEKWSHSGFHSIIFAHKPQRTLILPSLSNHDNQLLLDPAAGTLHKLPSIASKIKYILAVPSFVNLFVYQLTAPELSLSKFDLQCQANTQVTFTVGREENQTKNKRKRIYIYECEPNKHNVGKFRLVLRQQLQIIEMTRYKFKRGSFRIFLEQGPKKIHLLFSSKSTVNWQKNNDPEGSNFTLSLLSNHEIKVSAIEQLSREGTCVGDSSHLYQDCRNKISHYDQDDDDGTD